MTELSLCTLQGRDACEVDAPGSDLDEEQHLERPQAECLHGEEVGRHDALGLGPKELRPGRAGAPGSGAEPVSAQQSADRSGADPDPEVAQFTLDPHVAPPGVPRASRTTIALSSGSMGGRPIFAPQYVHLRPTSSWCQRSRVCGVTRKDAHRLRGSRRADAATKARSIGRSRGRLT